MSSITQKKSRRFLRKMESSADGEMSQVRSPRRWKLAAGVILFVVAAIVWLAPFIIAHSPMLGWIVGIAAGDLDGSVQVGSASLGWFSPVGLSSVEVRDRNGAAVLTIPDVKGDRSLISLAMNGKQLGTFRLDKPQINVVVDEKGTNIERLIAKYLEPSDEASPSVGVVIIEGMVTVEDRTNGLKNAAAENWKIENLDLAFAMPDGEAAKMTLSVSGILADARQAGKFAVEAESNRLAVKTGSLPLERITRLVSRIVPSLQETGLEMAGTLDCKAEFRWSEGGFSSGDMAVSMDAAAKGFGLTANSLGGDRVTLNELIAVGDFSRRDGRLTVEKAKVACDLGHAALLGAVAFDAATANAKTNAASGLADLGPLAPYAGQNFQLEGRLDVAKLAAMMPHTLHLHEQTKVTSGRLEVDLTSSKGKEGMVWTGRIATSDLTAMRRGKELVWQQPIVVTFNAHEANVGPTIDEFKCDSTFLTVQLAGWRENLEGSLRFDLDQLAQRLDAFVDLSGTRMAGKGWANLDWQRDKQNAFVLDADLKINGLMLAMGDGKPWSEEAINAVVNAAGRTDFRQNNRLDAAKLEIRLGGDQLNVTLAKPLAQIKTDAVWPLQVDASGQLAGWLERAKTWVDVGDLKLAGAYRLRAKGAGSADGASLDECELSVADLQFAGCDMNVSEPNARLTLVGQYDAKDRRLLLKTTQLESSSLTARGDGLILGMPENKPLELSGDISYQGELAGLQRWFADPAAAQTWRVGGRFAGKGRFKQVADVTNGQMEAAVENLTAINAAGQQLFEPKVQLVAAGVYDNSQRMLAFNQLKLTSKALGADLTGKVTAGQAGGGATSAIDGKINYNMEQLTTLLRPYLGGGVFIAGSGSRPMSLQGPLNLAGARAQGGLDWQQAYVYGFRVGQGEANLALRDGMVQLAPVSLAVSQGRVNLAAQLKLKPGPMELQVAPGPLAQQVRIDPEMCAYGLQYVAPALAGVTAVEGLFSIEMDECRIPLDNPAMGKLSGRFTVHSVEIGPGPLIREIVTVLLPGATSAKLTRESVIAFQMADGRVYHNGMELQFPELTIRTKGSVGLDKTLDMTAEMPIPPAWIRDARAAAVLRGQAITLPIRGTLDRPQIDQRRLAEYSRDFARRAAETAIQNEVGNQLNRLLGPKK